MRCVLLVLVCALLTLANASKSLPPHGNGGLPNGFVWGCMPGNVSASLPFCDPSRPLDERVQDLMSRLSLEEKMGLMGSDNHTNVDACNCMDAGVLRLGIPTYMNLVETNSAVASQCVAENLCATEFPSPAMLAASFNRSVWKVKGQILSDEMRALNNYGWHRGMEVPFSKIGLTGFGPNINIVRDPRFGRNSELPSEDPFLSGSYATEYVRGCQQGEDSRYLKMISGLKHYAAYSVENNRGAFIPNITTFDLWDTYLYQYRMAFSPDGGDAQAVMCSYAGVNGVPSCANNFLLNEVMRNTWRRPDALVVTDCGAIDNMVNQNRYAKDNADAAAKSLNGGSDIDFGDNYFPPEANGGNGGLADALQQKLTDESRINAAVSRILTARFRTGQFDPLDSQIYTTYGLDRVNSSFAQEFVLDAALQGMVLLENNGVLPLDEGGVLAVLGPHIYSRRDLFEDYKGDNECIDGTDNCVRTIAEVFSTLHPGKTLVAQGVELDSTNDTGIAAALAAADQADHIILFMGLGAEQEHEGIDRGDDISLPGLQLPFIEKVLALKKPTVLVLINGGMLAIEAVNERVDALVEAFYPAMRGAEALYAALFGKANRWGRLPVTIYNSSFTKDIAMNDFSVTSGPGRTYRYAVKDVLYEFGYGLSYADFEISCEMEVSGLEPTSGQVLLQCAVLNHDNLEGDEVLMVYHRPSTELRKAAAHPVPIKSLVEFGRVTVAALDFAQVFIAVPLERFALTNEHGDRVLYAGAHTVEVQHGTPRNVFTGSFTVPQDYVFPSTPAAVAKAH